MFIYRPILFQFTIRLNHLTIFDDEKAFDSAEHAAVFSWMRYQGINEDYVKFIENIWQQKGKSKIVLFCFIFFFVFFSSRNWRSETKIYEYS